jgi:hypothetical protein
MSLITFSATQNLKNLKKSLQWVKTSWTTTNIFLMNKKENVMRQKMINAVIFSAGTIEWIRNLSLTNFHLQSRLMKSF